MARSKEMEKTIAKTLTKKQWQIITDYMKYSLHELQDVINHSEIYTMPNSDDIEKLKQAKVDIEEILKELK